MMTDVDRAIEILRFNGHNVWRMDFPAPPVCAFDDANRRIGALTHFAVIENQSVSND